MQIGEKYSLAWNHPHRLEATIIALEQDHIVCEVDHRCSFACYLAGMKNTLPLYEEIAVDHDGETMRKDWEWNFWRQIDEEDAAILDEVTRASSPPTCKHGSEFPHEWMQNAWDGPHHMTCEGPNDIR